MPTWEIVAISLGAAVVKAASKTWFGGSSVGDTLFSAGTDLVRDASKDHVTRRRFQRFRDECGDKVGVRITHLLKQRAVQVDEGDRLMAIEAAVKTFDDVERSTGLALQVDLNPADLVRALQPTCDRILPVYGLSSAATELYHYLVRECATYFVEFLRTMPTFTPDAVAEVLRRQTTILEQLERVLQRISNRRAVNDFATDYRRSVAFSLDKMELFGDPVSEVASEYPLSSNYVTLRARPLDQAGPSRQRKYPATTGRASVQDALVQGQDDSGSMAPSPRTETLESIFLHNRRLLVLGEAGSGKTTLLRWLAVRMARQDNNAQLVALTDIMPFYIRLRDYADRPLPSPEQFLEQTANEIAGEMQPGWVHDQLRDRRAAVLVDGIDELPPKKRRSARSWLRRLLTKFPDIYCVVTSRPEAVAADWLYGDRFEPLMLEAMTRDEVQELVRYWHRSIARDADSSSTDDQLDALERTMNAALSADRNLRRLASNPLLCTLLCVLNRKLKTRLPRSRMEVYDAALSLLVVERDKDRDISFASTNLTREDKIFLLQQFAYWLVRNGQSEADLQETQDQFSIALKFLENSKAVNDPGLVTSYLVERSGVLRVPTAGRVDFIHRTFQDYLAAKAVTDSNSIGELLKNIKDDQWREVVVMAAGHARQDQCHELMSRLVDVHRRSPDDSQTALLVVACLQTVRHLEPRLRIEVENIATRLIPPPDMATAEALASAGDFVIDYLPVPDDSWSVARVVRTASLVGSPESLGLIAEIASARRWHGAGLTEFLRAGAYYDAEEYLTQVIKKLDFSSYLFDVETADLRLNQLPHLPGLRSARIGVVDLPAITNQLSGTAIDQLILTARDVDRYREDDHGEALALEAVDDASAGSRSPSERLSQVASRLSTELTRIGDRDPAASANLRGWEGLIATLRVWPGLSTTLPGLTSLHIEDLRLRDLRLIPPLPRVTDLHLRRWSSLESLQGLEQWSALSMLHLDCGDMEALMFDELAACPALEVLELVPSPSDELDIEPLVMHPGLVRLTVTRCELLSWQTATWRSDAVRLDVCPHQVLDGPRFDGLRVERTVACACVD